MAELTPSYADFAAALHTRFGLREDIPQPIELELVQVSELRSTPRQEMFSILFRGPLETPLVQRIYRMEHAQMGALELFIVPVARNEQGYEYEAVFNRLK
jgi:hypothetical protein